MNKQTPQVKNRPLPEHAPCSSHYCLDRRSMMMASGIAVSQTALGSLFPGRVLAEDAERQVQLATYPHKKIARLDSLHSDQPVRFSFPGPALHTECLLLALPTRAGGGIGPEKNIVAFSLRCAHMGADLSEGLRKNNLIMVCEEHLTSYDLTRHGMVIAGHATESLPQIVLEVQQSEIYAVGITGLLYGYHCNPTSVNR